MTFDENEILSRFHRALIREIRDRNPDHLTAPFTVAEIYQNLVPYRTHRDELGVEMNADYEHALLRLLAGEGGFLSIESETAREEIREELSSPNPNTGLYRDFAAADVRLNLEGLEDAFREESPQAEGQDAQVEGKDTQVDDEPMEVEVMEEEAREGFSEEDISLDEYEGLEVEPIGASLTSPGGMEGAGEEVDSGELPVEVSDEAEDEAEDLPPFENCPWCRESLPQQARVRFCPFCGSNVQLVPCPACGEELRLNWRFCIACGTEVES